MITRLRSQLRARWHLLLAVLGVCALPVAVWAAAAGAGAPLVALLLLQGAAMVGLSLAAVRGMTIQRRIRHIETRLKRLPGRAPAPIATPAKPPVVNLAPILNVLGAERLDAAHRHEELLARTDALREDLVDVERRFEARLDEVVGELAALHNLYRLVEVDREMPAPVGFAASPLTLLHLTDLALSLPTDRQIVECGSGASTVWFAAACRRAGSGRVIALEHSEKYGRATRAAIARHGLEDWAEVRTAPLEPVDVAGATFSWYARASWSDLQGVHLLFVDGPPGRVGPRSRYPAFPLLAPSLAQGAIVALDDSQREDEQSIGRSWISEGAAGVRLRDEGVVGRTWFLHAARSA
jgi:predicted O-methyltransferase YrrM